MLNSNEFIRNKNHFHSYTVEPFSSIKYNQHIQNYGSLEITLFRIMYLSQINDVLNDITVLQLQINFCNHCITTFNI